jgi:diguanylate cyclase (GGDEF)-like protein
MTMLVAPGLPAADAADGVLVVADGEVVLANGALRRMVGGDLVGHPAPDWLPSAPPSGEDLDVELPLPGAAQPVTVTLAAWDRGQVAIVRERSTVELHRLASRDPLTGLLNRGAFAARLAEESERLTSHGRALGVVVVDLDHFKAVNDRHGHPVGDRVLAEAAARIAGEARAVDSVGRIGGEEFAWLLPDAAAGETLAAAERLRGAIREHPFATGLDLTASIGVCDLATGDDPADLLERADRALYWAKACGRDTALVWSHATARNLARADGADFEALAALADAAGATGHATRVADLSVAIAARLDWSPVRQGRLHRAARLHDLGKAALPRELLRREGPLTPVELAHVRRHATIGPALAAHVLDAEQAGWIRHHHERDGGDGYPDRLAGDGIPDGARIIAIADVFDTMTTGRSYAAAREPDDALARLELEFRGADELLRSALSWWSRV